MRRYIAYAFLLIAILTFVVWVVSQFVQPIIPSTINNGLILFFAALLSVIAVIAGFKDIVELFRLLSDFPHKQETPFIDNVEKTTTPVTIFHNLPQPDYERFIGRQEEIKSIQKLLSPKSRHFVITIDGVGGVGKSALALEVAYKYLRRNSELSSDERFAAIIWTTAKKNVLSGEGVTAKQPALYTLENIYTTIAVSLNREDILSALDDHKNDLIRDALTKQRSLLIVDNLETIDDERVINFIRFVPEPTKVIVTTRHRIDIAYPIRLLGMSESEAKEFTTDECKKKNVEMIIDEINILIRRTARGAFHWRLCGA